MDTVRLGLIGVGNMGSAHASSIAQGNIAGMRLTALCDIDPSKRQWAEEHFPLAAVFDSYEKLLDSRLADAVLIATPHYFHPPLAVEAFRKGLHVLIEKPAGVYTKQVVEMNAAAEKAGTKFGIMFNQRTNPLYRKARELVRSGQLGQTKRLIWIITNWYRTQAYYDSGSWRATWSGEGGGVLLNQAPHNLDLWQWIFGMPSRVRAFCSEGKYHRIDVEDDATIYAEYENGATAVFITSTGEYPGTNRLEITGDRGKIVIEDGRLKFWRLSDSERDYCFSAEDGFAGPPTAYEEFVPNEEGSAHNGILQNFCNAVRFEEDLLAPGMEGINELTISNAAYLSSWTDDWVSLPINGDLFTEQLSQRIQKRANQNKSGKEALPDGRYSDRWNIHW